MAVHGRHDKIPLVTILFLVVLFSVKSDGNSGDDCTHTCVSSGTCRAKQNGGACFYMFPKTLTSWQENRDFCKRQGLTMAQPSTANLYDRLSVRDLFQDLDFYVAGSGLWLGGRSKNLNRWQFVKGNGGEEFIDGRITYSQQGNYTQCGFVYSDTLQIATQECRNREVSLCRIENCQKPADCLRVNPAKSSWFEARSECARRGGDLFYLSKNEQTFWSELEPSLRNLPAGSRIYIGLVSRLWLWNDNSKMKLTNWHSNHPDSGDESCLMIDETNSRWKDAECSRARLAFCQNGTIADSERGQMDEKTNFLQIVVKILGGLLGVSLFVNAVVAFVLLCKRSCRKKPQGELYSGLEQNKNSKGKEDEKLDRYSTPPVVQVNQMRSQAETPSAQKADHKSKNTEETSSKSGAKITAASHNVQNSKTDPKTDTNPRNKTTTSDNKTKTKTQPRKETTMPHKQKELSTTETKPSEKPPMPHEVSYIAYPTLGPSGVLPPVRFSPHSLTPPGGNFNQPPGVDEGFGQYLTPPKGNTFSPPSPVPSAPTMSLPTPPPMMQHMDTRQGPGSLQNAEPYLDPTPSGVEPLQPYYVTHQNPDTVYEGMEGLYEPLQKF